MELRDQIAMNVMETTMRSCLKTNESLPESDILKDIAALSYIAADAMLEARDLEERDNDAMLEARDNHEDSVEKDNNLSLDKLRYHIVSLTNKHGDKIRGLCVDILKKYQANRLSDIPPDEREHFLNDIKESIE